ncbi:MAG: ribose-5-phosphate isomerase RpiA [Methanothrix sp.]|jgi:ribose 5-phosphate isomerase A|uniref:ribose-5-phosphate isomerase RpiA n=1 Tax=Methanothrix sp. TaxID=90426 RepID=UPI0025EF63F2|nr:ribose-5-phosphate isomerase RpiA [Methanothrix sp.]MDI9417373.1 ribose-5-phosphate isomerase RpiA [Euryarchaeota archaeon]MBK7385610.1 ribose-5-phosphate isomerase RpiA [Methanothrix sp.]HON35174.1 ribose-5-phosphate isomerase RpiA [Methanothrix sp.]HPW73878.1 ribose-5-phosphate isomerase RpiA [Methanothrix sp.]HRU75550.1 ribose-5-phosphate isomerase RpiA [Methanothrix sp.]
MKDASSNASAKRAAGEAAAELVSNRMVVGLGTGSTVAWTIKRLGERVREEGLDFYGVPTSFQAEELAIESNISLTSLNQHPVLDLAIDGADQVSWDLMAIKGGGAAHTREKVVSCSARAFVIVADQSKFVERLSWPVPVEVLPFAAKLAGRLLEEMGGRPVLRLGRMKDGPVITDNGNFVMDVDFGIIEDPRSIAARISPIPGVVEHGIFDNLDELYLAREDGVERIKRR